MGIGQLAIDEIVGGVTPVVGHGIPDGQIGLVFHVAGSRQFGHHLSIERKAPHKLTAPKRRRSIVFPEIIAVEQLSEGIVGERILTHRLQQVGASPVVGPLIVAVGQPHFHGVIVIQLPGLPVETHGLEHVKDLHATVARSYELTIIGRRSPDDRTTDKATHSQGHAPQYMQACHHPPSYIIKKLCLSHRLSHFCLFHLY